MIKKIMNKNFYFFNGSRSRIQERTAVSLRGRHNLESSHTWGFPVQCLHYKPVSNHFFSGGGGDGVESISRGDCEISRRKTLQTFAPITSRNSAAGVWRISIRPIGATFGSRRARVNGRFSLLVILLPVWQAEAFSILPNGGGGGGRRLQKRRQQKTRHEILGHQLDKKLEFWLHAIHSLYTTGGFYRKPYSTLVLKIHAKKTAKQENLSLFMKSIL